MESSGLYPVQTDDLCVYVCMCVPMEEVEGVEKDLGVAVLGPQGLVRPQRQVGQGQIHVLPRQP